MVHLIDTATRLMNLSSKSETMERKEIWHRLEKRLLVKFLIHISAEHVDLIERCGRRQRRRVRRQLDDVRRERRERLNDDATADDVPVLRQRNSRCAGSGDSLLTIFVWTPNLTSLMNKKHT